jgi:hypothetical protein
MEPKCLLPCSQEPATDLYPQPDESNRYDPILFLSKTHFTIIIPTTSGSS